MMNFFKPDTMKIGTIKVDSKAGKGCRFILSLPLLQEQAQ